MFVIARVCVWRIDDCRSVIRFSLGMGFKVLVSLFLERCFYSSMIEEEELAKVYRCHESVEGLELRTGTLRM